MVGEPSLPSNSATVKERLEQYLQKLLSHADACIDATLCNRPLVNLSKRYMEIFQTESLQSIQMLANEQITNVKLATNEHLTKILNNFVHIQLPILWVKNSTDFITYDPEKN